MLLPTSNSCRRLVELFIGAILATYDKYQLKLLNSDLKHLLKENDVVVFYTLCVFWLINQQWLTMTFCYPLISSEVVYET